MSAFPGWVLPMADCRFGAPMGRVEWHEFAFLQPIKFHVRRVPLDSGGYDQGGAYWGTGDRLYVAYSTDGADEVVRMFFRVKEPKLFGGWTTAAQLTVCARYPNARFFK